MKSNIDSLLKTINDSCIKKINYLINKKTILFILILFTIIMLIPIIHISFYTHPSADDFNYGIYTINKINTEGIMGIISGIPKIVHKFYNTWQGTFSAIVIFSLNPSVWSDNTYFMTTFIMLFCIFFGIHYLLRQIVYKGLKIDILSLWIITISLFLFIIETIPSIMQGLYWWNGSSYYIIFYSLELIEISYLVKVYFLKERNKKNYFILYLLIFIIGGGNFITALQQIIILFLLNVYLLIAKKDKSGIGLLLMSLFSFGISAIAPGNAYRAKNSISMSPIKAILLSFYYAFYKTINWTSPFMLIIIPLLMILLYPTYKNNNFKFNYPLVVIFLIFGIFAAEFTPTLYSTSNIGEGRLWNIMYISYILFTLFGIYYLLGYIRVKINNNKIFTKNAYENIISVIKDYNIYIFIFIIGILSINIYFNRYSMTSYSTYASLRNKEAQTYDKEYKERLKILKNDNIKDVEFKEFSIYPYPIFNCEIDEDPNDWKNVPMATIYHKNSVRLIKEKGN